MANDESSNKEMASDSLEWNIMQSPNKKTMYFGKQGYESLCCILVVLQPKVGTLSTGFFADMMCELSCPFSE